MTPMVRIAALTNYLEEARHLINEVRLERVLRYMENLRYSLSRIVCLPGYGMPSSYRNNFIKCDHGKVKRIIGVTLGFKSMKRAYGTIKGIEVMRALCRGQTSPFSYGNPLGEMSGKQSL